MVQSQGEVSDQREQAAALVSTEQDRSIANELGARQTRSCCVIS